MGRLVLVQFIELPDKRACLLERAHGHISTFTQSPYELAIIDGEAAERRFCHPATGEEARDFDQEVSLLGHDPSILGYIPFGQ